MMQITIGILFSLGIIFLNRVLPRYFSSKLIASTILVSIAFIYVGFSLKNNSVSAIVLEVIVALIFYFIAIIGYVKDNSLIAIGIILHGVWDILHHGNLIVKTDIPSYWPVFCITIDIITGIYFWILFRNPAKESQKHNAIS